jgi:hypothetical protein
MPGQKKLNIWAAWAEYGTYQEQEHLYTCDWYEFQGSWVILHNAYDGDIQHTRLSIANATRVEER